MLTKITLVLLVTFAAAALGAEAEKEVTKGKDDLQTEETHLGAYGQGYGAYGGGHQAYGHGQAYRPAYAVAAYPAQSYGHGHQSYGGHGHGASIGYGHGHSSYGGYGHEQGHGGYAYKPTYAVAAYPAQSYGHQSYGGYGHGHGSVAYRPAYTSHYSAYPVHQEVHGHGHGYGHQQAAYTPSHYSYPQVAGYGHQAYHG